MMKPNQIDVDGRAVWVPPLDLSDDELRVRNAFLGRAFAYLAFNEISGDYAEFGCASARTFRLAHDHVIARGLAARLWAFDSFQGLPAGRDARDDHPRWREGKFQTLPEGFQAICDAHGMARQRYTMVPGIYADSLRGAGVAWLAPEIALANVDCDMHSSTADVLDFLKPRLKTGMIVYFDDYYCYADGRISGERRALKDFLAAKLVQHLVASLIGTRMKKVGRHDQVAQSCTVRGKSVLEFVGSEGKIGWNVIVVVVTQSRSAKRFFGGSLSSDAAG